MSDRNLKSILKLENVLQNYIETEIAMLTGNLHIDVCINKLKSILKEFEARVEKLDGKTEKKELDCGDCKHEGGAYGAWCFDTVGKCVNYEKFEPCPINEKQPEPFRCGHCGIEFKPYHDGMGINTGMCPKCLNEWNTVGLEEPSENEITEQLKRCEVCKQQMKILNNDELISEFITRLEMIADEDDLYRLKKEYEARSK